jgi:hypothetical protein
MKNETSDGIFCDYCGDQLKGDFVYYSYDFNEIEIINNLQRASQNNALSVDLCERCMELFRQRLLLVSKERVSTGIRCDITGENLGTTKNYYCCRVSKVDVNISNQQYKCVECGKVHDPQDGPCTCKQDQCELRRDAKVDVDDQYVQLNFSSAIFDKFRRHIDYIKGIGDAEWMK